MIIQITLNIAIFNWILGLFLIFISNCSGIISKTDYKRNGWKKYKIGYSIKEINEVINLIEEESIKKKLKQKIILRKVSFILLVSAPILIIIGNIL